MTMLFILLLFFAGSHFGYPVCGIGGVRFDDMQLLAQQTNNCYGLPNKLAGHYDKSYGEAYFGKTIGHLKLKKY